MKRRVILAGVLGGIAMFVWSSVAHMALPLGEAGVQQIDGEQPLLSAMQSTLHGPGLYLFPHMEANNDQAAYMKKIASGPSGLLVYLPSRQFNFGQSLGIEFLSETLQALIAAYLLSLTRVGTFAGRLGFFALAGLLAAVATNLSYWNWYAFPTTYTLGYMLTGWVGYVCAGAVAGALKLGG